MTSQNSINNPSPFDVSNGGTGKNAFTNHGIVYGLGTSPLGVTAAMNNGQLLIGQSGGVPVPALPTSSDGSLQVNASAGGLDFLLTTPLAVELKNCFETANSIAAAATTTLDLSTGNIFILNQATNITTLSITNAAASGKCSSITIIRVHNASTTTWSITWPASVKWPGGTAPSLTQTSGAVDVLELFTTDAGTTWNAFVAGLDVK